MFHRGLPKTQRTVVNGAKAGREVVPGTERSHTLPPNGPVSWHTTTLQNTTKHNESTTTQWHRTLTHTPTKHQTDLCHDTQCSQRHDNTTTHNDTQHSHTLKLTVTPNGPVSRHTTTQRSQPSNDTTKHNEIQWHTTLAMTQQYNNNQQNTTTNQ